MKPKPKCHDCKREVETLYSITRQDDQRGYKVSVALCEACAKYELRLQGQPAILKK